MRVSFVILSFAILGYVHSKPTSDSFKELANESLEDATNLFNAKAAVLKYTGESVNEAASYVGKSAVDFASSVDPIEITDDLEKSVLESKEASIKAVFDAKRTLIKGIQQVSEEHGAQISAIVDSSIQGVNDAIDSTAEGISVTKNAVAELSAQITLENTQQALAEAFDTSAALIQDTVDGLVQSLVSAKEQLHEQAESFSSEVALSRTKANIGATLSKTTSSAGEVAGEYGLFKGIDNVVKTLAKLPLQINKMLAEAQAEVGNKFEITKEVLVEAAIQENEDQKLEPQPDMKVAVNVDEESMENETIV